MLQVEVKNLKKIFKFKKKRICGYRGEVPGSKSSSVQPTWHGDAGPMTAVLLSSITRISNVSPFLPHLEVNINQNPE